LAKELGESVCVPLFIEIMSMRRLLFVLATLYLIGLQTVAALAFVKTDLAERIYRRINTAVFNKQQPDLPSFVEPSNASPPSVAEAPAPTAPVAQIPPRKRLTRILESDLFIYQLNIQLALRNLVPERSLFFIGDSHIRGLDVSAIWPDAVNFGISGDNSAGVLHRLGVYKKVIPALSSARAVVIAIGVNNLGEREDVDPLLVNDIRKILLLLGDSKLIVLNGLFPVDELAKNGEFAGYNARILRVNRRMSTLCNATENCRYVNAGKDMVDKAGNLAKVFRRKNDPVHLSTHGQQVWLSHLKRVIPPQLDGT
jgi:lysophospholipase L1-like esterase